MSVCARHIVFVLRILAFRSVLGSMKGAGKQVNFQPECELLSPRLALDLHDSFPEAPAAMTGSLGTSSHPLPSNMLHLHYLRKA